MSAVLHITEIDEARANRILNEAVGLNDTYMLHYDSYILDSTRIKISDNANNFAIEDFTNTFPQAGLIIGFNTKIINSRKFKNCSGFFGSLKLLYGITLNESAFEECTGFNGDLIIKNSDSVIGTNAFANCFNFKNVYANVPASKFASNSLLNVGNSFSKLYVSPAYISGYGSIGSTGFRGFSGTLQEWSI